MTQQQHENFKVCGIHSSGSLDVFKVYNEPETNRLICPQSVASFISSSVNPFDVPVQPRSCEIQNSPLSNRSNMRLFVFLVAIAPLESTCSPLFGLLGWWRNDLADNVPMDGQTRHDIWEALPHLKKLEVGEPENLCTPDPGTVMQPVYLYRYRYQRTIGNGNYGVVYLARDECTRKMVAIKKSHMSTKAEEIGIAKHEFDTSVAIGPHENILSIQQMFTHGGSGFLVMDLMPETLPQRSNRLNIHVVQGIIKQLVNAVAHIHSKNYVHNDIKHENILIESWSPRLHIRLTDFGLASLSGHGPVVGSKYFSPLEKILHLRLANRQSDDMYAIGILALELLLQKRVLSHDVNFCKRVYRLGTGPAPPELARKFPHSSVSQYPDLTKVLRSSPLIIGTGSREVQLFELFKDFVSQCLRLDWNNRLPANEASVHPFITWSSQT